MRTFFRSLEEFQEWQSCFGGGDPERCVADLFEGVDASCCLLNIIETLEKGGEESSPRAVSDHDTAGANGAIGVPLCRKRSKASADNRRLVSGYYVQEKPARRRTGEDLGIWNPGDW